MYGNGKKSTSDQNLAAWRAGREARRRAAAPDPEHAGGQDPDGSTERSGGGGPVGAGTGGAGVDLTQVRKERAAHALAALRDLEQALQAEIEAGDATEVGHLAADWLNDDATAVIEGLA